MQTDTPTRPQAPPLSAFLLAPAEGETRWMGETCTRFLATGASTGDRFCLVDETARRGEEVPLHRHSDDVEAFYVLEGEIAFFVDDRPAVSLGAHAFLHVPGGVVHGFRILSGTARYLILTTARHGEFYRAISVPSEADGKPVIHEVDWERIMETAERFGIELVGELPEA